MNIVDILQNIRLVLNCNFKIDIKKLVDLLVEYNNYIVKSNMMQYANDKIIAVNDILLQNENDEKLKTTRVMTHLEDAYLILRRQKEEILLKKNREKIQHKIDQVCCELAFLHKYLGNSSETIYKYAIELSSLKNPIKDSLGYGRITDETKQYFIMSKDDLKFLLTEEQYEDYIEFYCKVVPEAQKAKHEEEFLKRCVRSMLIE